MFSGVYFILLLGALILVHELGHFAVAKLSGVRVLTFSLGFGPALLRRKWGDTEYRLAAIPLGGYVRMFGDEPDAEVAEAERPFSFNYKPLPVRTAIVLAGPVMNLLLPFLVFFLMFASRTELEPSYIGAVKGDGPAAKAGLRGGDLVVRMDGEEVNYWWELESRVNASIGKPIAVEVRRGDEAFTTTVVPEGVEVERYAQLDMTEQEGRIQVIPLEARPILWVKPGGTAAAAGLRHWDRVLAVDGKPVRAFSQVEQILSSGGSHTLTVVREEPLALLGHLRLNTYGKSFEVVLPEGAGRELSDADLVIHSVDADSPAAGIGLKPGDRILTIDGESFPFWFLVEAYLAENVEDEHELTWTDGITEKRAKFSLVPSTEKGEFNEERKVVVFGAHNHSDLGQAEDIPNRARLSYALRHTGMAVKDAFEITLASLAGLVVGKVPIRDLGGPILIYDMASKTEKYGWEFFFNLMAWLSISLGMINLFPIPILDGGHLLFFAIEAVIRRPVPIRVRQIAAYVGLALILMLMVVVFRNDILRNWDTISGWFN
jgi:regulator of sigma E protease